MKKHLFPCEFCGEVVGDDPDYQGWKVMDRKGILHLFCSYLCALRFFGLGRDK